MCSASGHSDYHERHSDGEVPGRAFHTVILHKIPALSMERLPEVRRLITLIDVLYDHQVKVAPFLDSRPRLANVC